ANGVQSPTALIFASWKPPRDGLVKVTFCGFEIVEGQTMGVGANIRDNSWVFVARMAKKHVHSEEEWGRGSHSSARNSEFCSSSGDRVCGFGRGFHSIFEVYYGHSFK
ncbi:unnamed protein product, partial [Ilex paraguariensis]